MLSIDYGAVLANCLQISLRLQSHRRTPHAPNAQGAAGSVIASFVTNGLVSQLTRQYKPNIRQLVSLSKELLIGRVR